MISNNDHTRDNAGSPDAKGADTDVTSYVPSRTGGIRPRVRIVSLTLALGALLLAMSLAVRGDAGGGRGQGQAMGAGAGFAAGVHEGTGADAPAAPAPGAPETARPAGPVPAAPAAVAACDEATLRQAVDGSDAGPEVAYEVTYLKCAEGYGWAVISIGSDGAIVFLRLTESGMSLLDLGTGICAPETGIPADVAAQIAPPGEDPTGGCPTPAEPIESEADFAG